MSVPWNIIIPAIVSAGSNAAIGVKGPTAQPGRAQAGSARQQMESLYSQGDLLGQLASMKKDASMGGPLTQQRAPSVSSTADMPRQASSPMQSIAQPLNAPGAGGVSAGPLAYGSPRGSELMGGAGGVSAGPLAYGSPRGSELMGGAGGVSAGPAAQGASTGAASSGSLSGGDYAAIAASLVNAASSARGQSVQPPGFQAAPVSGLTPVASQRAVVNRGGGAMDMSQLIRMLSSQRGRRRF